MVKYSVIDLFAGAGGLSLGFMQTDKFDIKVAAENNPDARETYILNHEGTELLDDVCKIHYEDIVRRHGQIDVVIGGPPCQGFSNANRQKNHAISMNNRLVKEYVRAVCELQPKVFVMENVGMLRSKVHRFYYSETDKETIESLGIKLINEKIELLPPDLIIDKADELISYYDQIKRFCWDEKTYLILNVLYKQKKNPGKFKKAVDKYAKQLKKICTGFVEKTATDDEISKLDYELAKTISQYLEGKSDSEQLQEKLGISIHIQRMISKLTELKDHQIIYRIDTEHSGIYAYVKSYAVFDYIKGVLGSEPNNYKIKAEVLNAADFGAPQKRMRFIIIGVKNRGDRDIALPAAAFSIESYRNVRDAIGDLEGIKPVYEVTDPPVPIPTLKLAPESLAYSLRTTNVLHNHVITQSTETALKRFAALAEGQNFHDLKSEMKEDTYTDVKRTQKTIYLRLKYEEPSVTVVNVRKSMWIHPTIDRALSIREAARLQTFPDSFIFVGKKDAQYQQVGNAVPPILANAIAKKVLELLPENNADC
ncbi:MAG: DNA cytosine methyltransferase [Fermentimonas sp.]|nr:DNA cytosine methyltransferase [Fermentimonas sp.]